MTLPNHEATSSHNVNNTKELSSNEVRDGKLRGLVSKLGYRGLQGAMTTIDQKFTTAMKKGMVDEYLEVFNPSLHEQNEAFTTYEDNIAASRRLEKLDSLSPKLKQRRAFDSYQENIAATVSREKKERSRKNRNLTAKADYDTTIVRSLNELITDDKEILGDHARGLFRDGARKKADKIVDKINHAEGVKNIVTTREKYLEARSNFTKVRINKLEARIDNSPDNIFTRRLNGWRREKLHDLKAKNKKRGGATSNAEKKRQETPEALQMKVDELIKNRINAMYRKAQRTELRRNGIGKHNIVKRAEFLAQLTPDDKKRIVGEAIRQARKKSIELGRLDSGYSVDDVVDEDTVEIRKVTDHYGRIIE